MRNTTIKLAKQNAKRFKTEAEQDAYLRGFDRGFNCASWQDLPEIGSKVWTESDGKVTVNEDNQWDVVADAAYAGESNDRQFSPFEFTAAEFNKADEEGEEGDSEALWDAFDTGISDGIHANIAERKAA